MLQMEVERRGLRCRTWILFLRPELQRTQHWNIIEILVFLKCLNVNIITDPGGFAPKNQDQ